MNGPRVAFAVALLHPDNCPVLIVRHAAVTVVVVEPWADRYDVLRTLHADLTGPELVALSEAFCWPEGSVPAR